MRTEDSRRRLEPTPFVQPNVIGTITAWAGSTVSIPSGYALCNGANGTPDLRNRFVPCAGPVHLHGTTGGGTTHTHPFTSGIHSHVMPAGTDIAAGAGYNPILGFATASGTTDPGNSLPPYYSLAYIMYVGD